MRTKLLTGTLILAALSGAASGVHATPAFPKAVRAAPPQFDEKDILTEAVASPVRTSANTVRDRWRHPLESLIFWGLRPGDVIVELDPGGGYWTEILAAFARETGGRYIGALTDPDRQKPVRVAFETRFADASTWGKVETVEFGTAAGALAPTGSVDFILTSRSIHDLMRRGTLDRTLSAAFSALKPDGVLAVEEHRADPRPMIADARDGYVSEAYVIAAAQKAGFKLDARSEVNANPKDSKDHPFGVWTLPPTRRSAPVGQPTNPAFDHAKYDVIGESDRMTLRFRKPG